MVLLTNSMCSQMIKIASRCQCDTPRKSQWLASESHMMTAGFLLLPKAQAHVFTPTVKQKICREFSRDFFKLVQLLKDCVIFCINFYFFLHAPFKFRASFFQPDHSRHKAQKECQ